MTFPWQRAATEATAATSGMKSPRNGGIQRRTSAVGMGLSTQPYHQHHDTTIKSLILEPPLSARTSNDMQQTRGIRPHSGSFVRQTSVPVVHNQPQQASSHWSTQYQQRHLGHHPPGPPLTVTATSAPPMNNRFDRVTTLGMTTMQSPATLTTRSAPQEALSHALSGIGQRKQSNPSLSMTPGKLKLANALDTTQMRRHNALPRMNEAISAPSVIQTSGRAVSVGHDKEDEQSRFGSARRYRHQNHHATTTHHNNNSQRNGHQTTRVQQPQSAHLILGSLAPTPSNGLTERQTPSADGATLSSPRNAPQQSDHHVANKSLVISNGKPFIPLLSLPSQPNGTSAQQAAAALLAEPTHRQHNNKPHPPPTSMQPSPPTPTGKAPGSGHSTQRQQLSARVQNRRFNRQSNKSMPATNLNGTLTNGITRAGSAYTTNTAPAMSSKELQYLTAAVAPTATLAVGVADDPNTRYRATMEDAHVIKVGFGTEHLPNELQQNWKHAVGYVGIYDGHGGRDCVDFVASHLHLQVGKEMRATPSDPVKALTEAFLKTDDAMKNDVSYQECGSTVVSAVVRPSVSRQGQRDLYVANVGDARAVIAVGSTQSLSNDSDGGFTKTLHGDTKSAHSLTAQRLSKDHVPRTPGEINRVIRAGGCVFNNRVAGQLAVSRAMGDMALKRSGVSAQPHVVKLQLTAEHKYLIIACDGLWDVITDHEAVDMVKDLQADPQLMAERLVQVAMDRNTTDNVSVAVVKLQK